MKKIAVCFAVVGLLALGGLMVATGPPQDGQNVAPLAQTSTADGVPSAIANSDFHSTVFDEVAQGSLIDEPMVANLLTDNGDVPVIVDPVYTHEFAHVPLREPRPTFAVYEGDFKRSMIVLAHDGENRDGMYNHATAADLRRFDFTDAGGIARHARWAGRSWNA